MHHPQGTPTCQREMCPLPCVSKAPPAAPDQEAQPRPASSRVLNGSGSSEACSCSVQELIHSLPSPRPHATTLHENFSLKLKSEARSC